MILWAIFGIIILLVFVVKVYQKLTVGICRTSAHMVGKVVIVTGGNSGLGLETCKDLASRGAKVILACRSARRANEAKEEIIKFSGNPDVHFRELDLASLRSVKDFCAQIYKTEKRVDVLINNAGAGGLGNGKTADGLHIGMQVNYFAPFLLTCLLVPLMKTSAPSRIINVSSMMHKYGELDFDNLNMEKYWSDYIVYANSKLFLNLMTLELSSRLKGTGVTVNALHPGVAATNIFRNIPSNIIRNIVEKCIGFTFQTSWEAAQTSIYLAVTPEVEGVTGKYFSDCREKKPSICSQNAELAKRLWLESEKLVKFSLPDN
ncbi:hypothetical protein PYW07_001681 [Mythimna separata]|uniref:Uncharacterized protein n=1 Tax=Mythimna separata TaxID=271217 RepID=A0AAD8DW47_MYTSE|nr:hypothetical protein PYW07_001681 [Mythimna separata]